MAGTKISGVHIDAAALAEAIQKDPETRKAVNRRSKEILNAVQGMSASFKTLQYGRYTPKKRRTGRKTGRPFNPAWMADKSGETVGGTTPKYGRKPSTAPENFHSIVYTANYAAMKFELDNNGLAKASR